LLLAKSLSSLIGQPVDSKTLIRSKRTESQVTLNAADRIMNVTGAFATTSSALQDKIVLLIDDVCTTGATLDGCAGALKIGGARQVYGLALARAC
jgi:predicted amidophosphoribosyltransferase